MRTYKTLGQARRAAALSKQLGLKDKKNKVQVGDFMRSRMAKARGLKPFAMKKPKVQMAIPKGTYLYR